MALRFPFVEFDPARVLLLALHPFLRPRSSCPNGLHNLHSIPVVLLPFPYGSHFQDSSMLKASLTFIAILVATMIAAQSQSISGKALLGEAICEA